MQVGAPSRSLAAVFRPRIVMRVPGRSLRLRALNVKSDILYNVTAREVGPSYPE